jgi:hypothetical protein
VRAIAAAAAWTGVAHHRAAVAVDVVIEAYGITIANDSSGIRHGGSASGRTLFSIGRQTRKDASAHNADPPACGALDQSGSMFKADSIRQSRPHGAEAINDFVPGDQWSSEANLAWIRQMRAERREIIDIGPDFDRRLNRVLDRNQRHSDVYNMERIELKNYDGYRRNFNRSERYQGD